MRHQNQVESRTGLDRVLRTIQLVPQDFFFGGWVLTQINQSDASIVFPIGAFCEGTLTEG